MAACVARTAGRQLFAGAPGCGKAGERAARCEVELTRSEKTELGSMIPRAPEAVASQLPGKSRHDTRRRLSRQGRASPGAHLRDVLRHRRTALVRVLLVHPGDGIQVQTVVGVQGKRKMCSWLRACIAAVLLGSARPLPAPSVSCAGFQVIQLPGAGRWQ